MSVRKSSRIALLKMNDMKYDDDDISDDDYDNSFTLSKSKMVTKSKKKSYTTKERIDSNDHVKSEFSQKIPQCQASNDDQKHEIRMAVNEDDNAENEIISDDVNQNERDNEEAVEKSRSTMKKQNLRSGREGLDESVMKYCKQDIAYTRPRARSPENESMKFFFYNASTLSTNDSEEVEPDCLMVEANKSNQESMNSMKNKRIAIKRKSKVETIDGEDENYSKSHRKKSTKVTVKSESYDLQNEINKNSQTEGSDEGSNSDITDEEISKSKKVTESKGVTKCRQGKNSAGDVVRYRCANGDCSYESKNKKSFRKHILRVHGISDITYKCDYPDCSYETNTNHKLIGHTIRVHAEKSFKCRLCDSAFGVKSDLYKHERRHTERHICVTCGKVYKSKNVLIEHIKSHETGYIKLPLACPICGKLYTNKYLVNRHVKRQHENKGMLYKCRICERTFSARNVLRDHINIHTGERPYKCTVCEKTFGQSRSLSVHMTVHSDICNYTCHLCGKTFKQRSALVLHMNCHKEAGERPHVCKVCNKRFTQSQSLVRHERIHNGEKPFQCKECDKRFNDSSILRRHMFTHNRNRQAAPSKGKAGRPIHYEKTNNNTNTLKEDTSQSQVYVDKAEEATQVNNAEETTLPENDNIAENISVIPVTISENEFESIPPSYGTEVNGENHHGDGQVENEAEQCEKEADYCVAVPPGASELVVRYHNPEVDQQEEIVVYVEDGINMSQDELIKGALLASGVNV